MPEDWLSVDKEGFACLNVYVQPGAKRTEWAGFYGNALKIRLAAPPVEGKANAALLQCLAEWLAVPKNALTLKSGQTSRHKVVRVAGVTPEVLQMAIEKPSPSAAQ